MRQGLSGMRFSPMYYQGDEGWINSTESHPLWERAESREAVFNFFITTAQLPRLEEMVARFPRRVFLPVVYLFFIACLLCFYWIFHQAVPGQRQPPEQR